MHLEKKTHPVAYYEKNTIGRANYFFIDSKKRISRSSRSFSRDSSHDTTEQMKLKNISHRLPTESMTFRNQSNFSPICFNDSSKNN